LGRMDHASGGRLNRIGLTQMQPLFLEGMFMLEPCQQEGKMGDLVKRLRDVAHTYDEYGVHSELELEAAARIERLERDAARIERLERDFALAKLEMMIADRNRIHFQKELEQFMAMARDQAENINELRNAIYHYVNWIMECEGISFIDELPGPEMDHPKWAKLINQVWDEVKKEEGEKDD